MQFLCQESEESAFDHARSAAFQGLSRTVFGMFGLFGTCYDRSLSIFSTITWSYSCNRGGSTRNNWTQSEYTIWHFSQQWHLVPSSNRRHTVWLARLPWLDVQQWMDYVSLSPSLSPSLSFFLSFRVFSFCGFAISLDRSFGRKKQQQTSN